MLLVSTYKRRCDSVESLWSLKHRFCFSISYLLWLCSGCLVKCFPVLEIILLEAYQCASESETTVNIVTLLTRYRIWQSIARCLQEFRGIHLHTWIMVSLPLHTASAYPFRFKCKGPPRVQGHPFAYLDWERQREVKRGFVYEHNTWTLAFCIAWSYSAPPLLQSQGINHIVMYYITPPCRTLGFVFCKS